MFRGRAAPEVSAPAVGSLWPWLKKAPSTEYTLPLTKELSGPRKEGNHVSDLLCCPLPLEGAWFVERRVLWPAHAIPVLLHQRRINGPRRYRIDAHLPSAIFLSCRLGKAYHGVLARIVCGMLGEAFSFIGQQQKRELRACLPARARLRIFCRMHSPFSPWMEAAFTIDPPSTMLRS